MVKDLNNLEIGRVDMCVLCVCVLCGVVCRVDGCGGARARVGVGGCCARARVCVRSAVREIREEVVVESGSHAHTIQLLDNAPKPTTNTTQSLHKLITTNVP